ncbi:carbon monoxide dehydrogenase subunit G [Advenella sp. WQ 585]|uniref:Carbon monoxide dehydrogenase subunit G n=1 Tax=Advenella mandrilli TaxID=2800330 RepID=A0ABS1EH36_9BURK|nr:carbon monoxide dehydrogenase subunit G [Advenella mandrilli]MBK1782320.1 carbon monoxide dehydrogenase subunit G [Advenella mandrilli]
MILNGEQQLPVSREQVWAALMNPEVLRLSIPGCESVTEVEPGIYAVKVVIEIGPVKARFNGKLRQLDMKAPETYTLAFEGDGGVAGFAKGSAVVTLEEGANKGTVLKYEAKAEIGGRLAQIGSRLIDATSAKLTKQFFERFSQQLLGPAPAVAEPAKVAAPAMGTAVAAAGSAVAATPAFVPAPVYAQATPSKSGVSIQMPAWTWAFTVLVIALLAAYLGSR